MPPKNAQKAMLVGGGMAADGEHGALVFETAEKEPFALALGFDQYPELIRAAALLHSEARARHGGAVPPVPVERWSTEETPDTAILSLRVYGGLELRFELSRHTQDVGEDTGKTP